MKRLMAGLCLFVFSIVLTVVQSSAQSVQRCESGKRYVAAYKKNLDKSGAKTVVIVEAPYGVTCEQAIKRAQKLTGQDVGDRWVAGYKKKTREVMIVRSQYGTTYQRALKEAEKLRQAAARTINRSHKPESKKTSSSFLSSPDLRAS